MSTKPVVPAETTTEQAAKLMVDFVMGSFLICATGALKAMNKEARRAAEQKGGSK